MQGIHIAAIGTLQSDAAVRTRGGGRDWLSMLVVVETGPDERMQLPVAAFSPEIVEQAQALTSGVEVYFEGKLRERTWRNPETGVTLTRINATANLMVPLGLIGQKRPKKTRAPKKAEEIKKTVTGPNDELPF